MTQKQGFLECIVQRIENVPGMLQEPVPLCCQSNPVGLSFKQIDPQIFLQLSHCRGNRGLGNMDIQCRLGETARGGSRHKVA